MEKRIVFHFTITFLRAKNHDEKTAHNGRFGASGAVARPKVCADLEVLRPSERQ